MSETTGQTRRRVFVLDDHPIVRQGLSTLINSQADLTACGEAEDAHAALGGVFATRADAVIADISLPGPDGLDFVKALRARGATLPVLVFSMHDETIYAERAIRAGANGYVMKHEPTASVLIALRRLLKGDVYLSARAGTRLMQQFVPGGTPRRGLAGLSDRELEVYRLIGEGRTTRQIALELHLSVKTVETYQAHIKDKLALRSARELVQHAVEWYVTEQATSLAGDRRADSPRRAQQEAPVVGVSG